VIRPVLSLAWCLVAAAPLTAQSLAEACAAVGELTVGQWAQYQLTSPEIPGGATMRFAVVGTEAVGGTEHYWHETTMTGAMGEVVMQMLIAGYPYADGDIQRMIVKQGNQPAMEFSAQMMAMMRQSGAGRNPAQSATDDCGAATLVGTETVTVPAGSFDVLRIRPAETNAGDLWLDIDIPFAIVRFSDGVGNVMELVAHGMDATSAITETPRKMPGMP
jgi:hypothetical protein